jgi:hypothetical protein
MNHREVMKRSINSAEVLSFTVEKHATHGVIDGLVFVAGVEFENGKFVVCDRRISTLRSLKLSDTLRKCIPRVEGPPRLFKGKCTLKKLGCTRRNGTISADQVLPHTKGIHLSSTFPVLAHSITPRSASI